MTKFGKNIVGYFLVILFVLYYGSVTLLGHSHTVNGVTIVHSHPFKSNKHQHSTAEFKFISILSNFISLTIFSIFLIELIKNSSFYKYIIEKPLIISTTHLLSNGLRAPPRF
jgi:hypothetical protein